MASSNGTREKITVRISVIQVISIGIMYACMLFLTGIILFYFLPNCNSISIADTGLIIDVTRAEFIDKDIIENNK